MAKRARSKAAPQKAPSSDGLATSVYNRRRKVSFGTERLSLYHEPTGGEAALARKRRDDVIRAGGHVYETPPLAKGITMATPAE